MFLAKWWPRSTWQVGSKGGEDTRKYVHINTRTGKERDGTIKGVVGHEVLVTPPRFLFWKRLPERWNPTCSVPVLKVCEGLWSRPMAMHNPIITPPRPCSPLFKARNVLNSGLESPNNQYNRQQKVGVGVIVGENGNLRLPFIRMLYAISDQVFGARYPTEFSRSSCLIELSDTFPGKTSVATVIALFRQERMCLTLDNLTIR